MMQSALSDAPGLAVGWMVTRTARVTDPSHSDELLALTLTMASGARARADRGNSGSGAFAASGLAKLNTGLDHSVPVSAMGEMLKTAGYRRWEVITQTPAARSNARWMVADRDGLCDDWIQLTHFDLGALIGNVRRFVDKSQTPYTIAFELPGIFQCRRDRLLFRDPQFQTAMDRATAETVWMLRSLIRLLKESGRPFRLVAYGGDPAEMEGSYRYLAPLVVASELRVSGKLTSPSTRIEGIITATDILPTVAEWIGQRAPSSVTGRAAWTYPLTSDKVTPTAWRYLGDRASADGERQRVFGGMPTVQLLIAISLLIGCTRLGAFITTTRIAEYLSAIAPGISLTTIVMPVLLLLAPLVIMTTIPITVAILGLIAALCVVVGLIAGPQVQGNMERIAAVSALLILLDLIMGAPLQKHSWLSYSIGEGARFYGIGNEGGAAFFGLTWIICWRKPRFGALLLAVSAVLIGLPTAGANLGVAVGFLVSAAGLLISEAPPERRRMTVVGAVAATLTVPLALLVWDSLRGASQSHLGKALSGGEGVISIGIRKIAMNGFLVLHSSWTPLLLVGIIGLAAVWRENDELWEASERRRGAAWLAGTMAMFAVNDSGLVAAAISTSIVWAYVVLLGWSRRTLKRNGEETLACPSEYIDCPIRQSETPVSANV